MPLPPGTTINAGDRLVLLNGLIMHVLGFQNDVIIGRVAGTPAANPDPFQIQFRQDVIAGFRSRSLGVLRGPNVAASA